MRGSDCGCGFSRSITRNSNSNSNSENHRETWHLFNSHADPGARHTVRKANLGRVRFPCQLPLQLQSQSNGDAGYSCGSCSAMLDLRPPVQFSITRSLIVAALGTQLACHRNRASNWAERCLPILMRLSNTDNGDRLRKGRYELEVTTTCSHLSSKPSKRALLDPV